RWFAGRPLRGLDKWWRHTLEDLHDVERQHPRCPARCDLRGVYQLRVGFPGQLLETGRAADVVHGAEVTMRSVLPWLVTLAALIVMVVVIVQRPMPALTQPAKGAAEPPLDSGALSRAKALIAQGGEWKAEEVAAFREAYFKLPTKERV